MRIDMMLQSFTPPPSWGTWEKNPQHLDPNIVVLRYFGSATMQESKDSVGKIGKNGLKHPQEKKLVKNWNGNHYKKYDTTFLLDYQALFS